MRAIVYSEPGDSGVLRLVERDIPEPGAGEVRVRIAVSGVNPTDWKSRRGAVDSDRVPNQDGAGVIDALGDGVTEFALGDRVWLVIAAYERPLGGTAQEFAVLPIDRVFALPDETSFDIGASLGVPAVTAYRALTVNEPAPSRLAPGALAGRTVLVTGGAGAVGHAAIQLARWAGATVITTISGPEKAALAAAAGAHHIVNYREQDAASVIKELAPDGVDTIVEVAGVANAELDQAVLRTGGTIALYATAGPEALEVNVRAAMTLNARYQFVLLYTVPTETIAGAAEDINAALRDNALPVGADAGLPLHRFSLESTAEAHDAIEADIVGKVLIDVGGSF